MKNNHQKLLERIDQFAARKNESFAFDELLAFLKKEVKVANEDYIFDTACESDALFLLDNEMSCERFIPRHVFFKGAEFRITPLPEEVKEGLLIPGHRFVPYLPRTLFPAKARLILPDGTPAKMRTVVLPHDQVSRCLLFYGQYGEINYLLEDHMDNSEQIKPPFDQPLRITVFDLRDFFQECSFQPGDSLMLTVQNTLNGTFSVRHVPAATGLLSFSLTHDWTQTLKEAFEEASLNRPGVDDCQEQMAQMLFYAGLNGETPVTTNPPLSLAAFFSTQNEWTLRTIGDSCFFWPREEDPAAALLDHCREHGPMEPESELDAYFQHLGLSISLEEAAAYIRGALAEGATDAKQPLGRMIAGRDLYFPSAAEQKEFHRLWKEFFEEVKASYCAQSDPFRDLRQQFLAINDKCLQTMRQMDARGMHSENILTHPTFMEFNHLTAMIASALALFNDPEADDEDPDQPFDESVLELLSTAVDDLCARLLSSEKTVVKHLGFSHSEKIYQLKVTLKGSKPPIWRRILFSAGFELQELHEAIQAFMGWNDCHLHQFKHGQTLYEPNPDPDMLSFMDIETSIGIPICRLLRKEKDRLIYEYDFGDSWEHEILLEKIIDPEEELDYPRCVAGKRACPPEDCGGIYGYADLLKILKNPSHTDYKRMKKWVGKSFDPEHFDVDEANRRF